jgi:hypothetical protein
VLAVNSELNGTSGGVSSIRFHPTADISAAYRILGGTAQTSKAQIDANTVTTAPLRRARSGSARMTAARTVLAHP